ncbi:MAG: MoaD/ThiS family protein [Isosphaeraceae bacterium]
MSADPSAGQAAALAKGCVSVQLFAVARQCVGRSEIALDLPLPASVADFRVALAAQYPELARLASIMMIAVDTEYATDTSLIQPGAQVALIPPVSGG